MNILKIGAVMLGLMVLASCSSGGNYVQTAFTAIGPGYKQNSDGTFEVAVLYGAAKSNYAPGLGTDAQGNEGVVRFRGPCGEETPPAVAMPTNVTLEAGKLGVSEGIFLGSAANNMTAAGMIKSRAAMSNITTYDVWPSYQYDCTKTKMDEKAYRGQTGGSGLPTPGEVVDALDFPDDPEN